MKQYSNRFYKTTNEFICIDLLPDVIKLVNEHDHPGLQVIHIFVYDPMDVRIDALVKFGEEARKRKMKVLVHCFDKRDRAYLRKKLKGVPKDEWFHLTNIVSVFKMSLSEYVWFEASKRGVEIFEHTSPKDSKTYGYTQKMHTQTQLIFR